VQAGSSDPAACLNDLRRIKMIALNDDALAQNRLCDNRSRRAFLPKAAADSQSATISNARLSGVRFTFIPEAVSQLRGRDGRRGAQQG
jgi:hypothetical protein